MKLKATELVVEATRQLHDGLITECDCIKQVQSAILQVDWNEFKALREKELEDATYTLIHLTEKDSTAVDEITNAMAALRFAGWKVSHTEDSTFYAVSPPDSWGAVQRTEGKNPRFLLDLYNALDYTE